MCTLSIAGCDVASRVGFAVCDELAWLFPLGFIQNNKTSVFGLDLY